MIDTVYFLIFWYSDIHRVSKEVEGRQTFLLSSLIMLSNWHGVSYRYLLMLPFLFSVGQEIKSRILVSTKWSTFFHEFFCFIFLDKSSLIDLIGGKSSRGLCPPVHELHECHFCSPEAGKNIDPTRLSVLLTSCNLYIY